MQHYELELTDFFPGIAHSQLIKLRVPSWFLSGRATNPYETKIQIRNLLESEVNMCLVERLEFLRNNCFVANEYRDTDTNYRLRTNYV